MVEALHEVTMGEDYAQLLLDLNETDREEVLSYLDDLFTMVRSLDQVTDGMACFYEGQRNLRNLFKPEKEARDGIRSQIRKGMLNILISLLACQMEGHFSCSRDEIQTLIVDYSEQGKTSTKRERISKLENTLKSLKNYSISCDANPLNLEDSIVCHFGDSFISADLNTSFGSFVPVRIADTEVEFEALRRERNIVKQKKNYFDIWAALFRTSFRGYLFSLFTQELMPKKHFKDLFRDISAIVQVTKTWGQVQVSKNIPAIGNLISAIASHKTSYEH